MVKSLSYGGFWIRFLAYFIDGILLSVAAGLLFGNTCEGAGYCAGYDGWRTLIPVAYFIGFWTWKGATPGKMICKLKIVDLHGGPINIKTAALRFVGYILSGVALCIGFIWIGFDEKKQGWHDKIAKTYVVKL
ncbi:MAG: RDD family protein [Patescibacteria group bacterium]